MAQLTKRQLFSLTASAAFLTSLPRAQAAPGKQPVLELALNENPFGPSPKAEQALAAQLKNANRYGDALSADQFVEQVARFENVAPEQIILGEILELLGLFLAARAPVGGNIVYSSPGYMALVDAGKPGGLTGVGVPLDASLKNDLPELAKAITPQTKALYLVNPHNPSGTVSAPADFEKFLRDVSRKTLVIVDEAYLEYGTSVRSAVSLTRQGENVAVFRTFDKIYGLAGLPIGYLVAPRSLATALRDAGFGNPHGLGRLAISAASAALTDQNWVRSVHTRIAAGRTRLTQTLDSLTLKHTDSEANFVFFQSPKPVADVREQFAKQGIVIARPFAPLNDWLRISVGTEAEVTRVISALKEIFAA
ncbi:pyridoxal phosphate-dependent aminotransferase [Acetobacter persici]|uniref:Aspartate aminotransferase n=1 Tax=Acetobacter persici TaxID=1076596 RepID=A0A1U9LI25_9PROT|nr:histidinol-phosphate transaminase [Acetobacter persici]AQT06047.1 aspartate aminotransferase [Acetobacter persici]